MFLNCFLPSTQFQHKFLITGYSNISNGLSFFNCWHRFFTCQTTHACNQGKQAVLLLDANQDYWNPFGTLTNKRSCGSKIIIQISNFARYFLGLLKHIFLENLIKNRLLSPFWKDFPLLEIFLGGNSPF